MSKFLFLLSFSTLFFCCQKGAEPKAAIEGAKAPSDAPVMSGDLTLQNFIPDSTIFKGCNCLLKEQGKTAEIHESLFAYSIGVAKGRENCGMVNVGGEIVKLTFRDFKLDGKTSHYLFDGSGLTVKVVLAEGKKKGERSAEHTGEMSVERTDGKKTSYQITGICGCENQVMPEKKH